MQRWMIYGANGYSAGLIIEKVKEARAKGIIDLDPILAGRNAKKVMELGAEHGMQACAFSLEQQNVVEKCLQNVEVVLNCAGPFSQTAEAMVRACIRTKTIYLDITGEIDVFEAIHRMDSLLKEAGTTAIPGVGFDVVPSDCLAAMLANELPDANHLQLAFFPKDSRFSPGTMKTMVEGMSKGGRIRRDGQIITVPSAYDVMKVPFTEGMVRTCATIPWGDVSTAYHSTGIPNIEVYTTVTDASLRSMKLSRYTGWLMGVPALQNLAKRTIGRKIKGPDAETRERARTFFWGQVTNAKAQTVTKRMETPEGYSLTAETAWEVVQRCLRKRPSSGALTPSKAFGADLITAVPGVKILS